MIYINTANVSHSKISIEKTTSYDSSASPTNQQVHTLAEQENCSVAASFAKDSWNLEACFYI